MQKKKTVSNFKTEKRYGQIWKECAVGQQTKHPFFDYSATN